jgi:hypothetical protein
MRTIHEKYPESAHTVSDSDTCQKCSADCVDSRHKVVFIGEYMPERLNLVPVLFEQAEAAFPKSMLTPLRDKSHFDNTKVPGELAIPSISTILAETAMPVSGL